MKEITIYVCEDGARFDSKIEALEYEKLRSGMQEITCKVYQNGFTMEDRQNAIRAHKLELIN